MFEVMYASQSILKYRSIFFPLKLKFDRKHLLFIDRVLLSSYCLKFLKIIHFFYFFFLIFSFTRFSLSLSSYI